MWCRPTTHFDLLNYLGVTEQCDRLTDGHKYDSNNKTTKLFDCICDQMSDWTVNGETDWYLALTMAAVLADGSYLSVAR